MRRLISLFLFSFTLLFPQEAFSEGTEPFGYDDLDSHHKSYYAIQYLTEMGVVHGYTDGRFGADEPIRRDEALKIIIEGSFIELEAPVDGGVYEERFRDVKSDDWSIEYIDYAYQNNVIEGYEDNYFHPEWTVSRAEALKMLALLNNEAIEEYPETSDLPWYQGYIDFAAEKNLLTPTKEGDYLPNDQLSRGELAQIIYRYQTSPYTGEVEWGVASYYGWSFDGANTASGTPLEAAGYMAAHKTLPFGTMVKVSNPSNNKSVIVKIVDRGPYTEGRVIDLTPGAFEAIANLSQGVVHVNLEVLN